MAREGRKFVKDLRRESERIWRDMDDAIKGLGRKELREAWMGGRGILSDPFGEIKIKPDGYICKSMHRSQWNIYIVSTRDDTGAASPMAGRNICVRIGGVTISFHDP